MPTNTADQGLTLPLQADAANEQTAMASYNTGVESRLAKRYVDVADRTARNPTPTIGEISYLTNPGRHDFFSSASAWWELRPLFVRKPTETQVVNNSTVLVNDDALFVPMQINARYSIMGMFWWDSGTTGDIKWAWTVPAGGAMSNWTVLSVATSAANNVGNADASLATTAGGLVGRVGAGIGTFSAGWLMGIVTTAGTAGNLQLQWAQSAAEAVNTRMKTGSWIQLTRVG